MVLAVLLIGVAPPGANLVSLEDRSSESSGIGGDSTMKKTAASRKVFNNMSARSSPGVDVTDSYLTPFVKVKFEWHESSDYAGRDSHQQAQSGHRSDAHLVTDDGVSIADSPDDLEAAPDSDAYMRIQLPMFSVAMVDSSQVHEIIRFTAYGFEYSHNSNERYTDSSLNLMWAQVDNQLPRLSSEDGGVQRNAVVLIPTSSAYPPPTLLARIRKNNSLSKDDLSTYDTVQFVLQQLNVQLEQRTGCGHPYASQESTSRIRIRYELSRFCMWPANIVRCLELN